VLVTRWRPSIHPSIHTGGCPHKSIHAAARVEDLKNLTSPSLNSDLLVSIYCENLTVQSVSFFIFFFLNNYSFWSHLTS
jgi:recombinational DNA repair protein (RecF pathway)